MVGLRERYERNPRGFFAVLLFCIPLVVYSYNLTFGFVLDDNIQVLNNPWIRDAGYIPKILFSTAWAYADEHGAANSYRPVMHFVYMAEYHVFGLSPRWFHLVNMVLHSLNTVLIFLIASFLFTKYSDRESSEKKSASRYYLPFIAGLLFALHPINTGVVSWVAAVPELTYTLFFLLAFYQYMRAQKGSTGLSMPRYLSSCLFFFLALMSKEPAIVLPLFIMLYDFTLRGGGILRLWKRYAPYMVILMAYIFLRLYAMGGLMHHKEVAFTPYESFINVFPLVARYTGKLLLPINLNIIYPLHPVSSILEPLSIAGLVIVIIFLSVTFLLYRSRVLFISLFWIALPLVPALYIPALPVGGFANRYLYLSTGGFAILVCLLIGRLLTLSGGLRKAAIALIIIILPLYTAGAVLRSMVWRDDYTLWTDMLKKAPEFERAHFSYAWILQQRGDVDEAIYHYREALKSRPDNVKAHYNIAVLYYGKGQINRAMLHYKAAIRLDPKNIDAYYNLAIIYQQMGDNAKAIPLYRVILKINPQNENAHFNVARAYEDEGKAEKAVLHYREVIRLRPQSADAYYRLGLIYASHGNLDEAARSFNSALRANPKYEAARVARDALR